MRIPISLLLGGAILIFTLISCKASRSGKDLSLFIPSESAMVLAFQPGTLFDKLDYSTLDTMEGYKNNLQSLVEENETLAAIFKDPKQSGILLNGTAFLVGLIDPAAMEASGMYVLFNLDDVEKFKKLVAAGSSEKPTNVEDFQSQALGSGSLVLWNNDMAILSLFSGVAPEQIHQRFLKLQESNSFKNNKTMFAALDQKSDLSMVMTTDPLAKSDMVKFFMSMVKMDAAILEGNVVNAHCNFGKTKAEMVYQGTFSSGLKSLFGPIFKDKVQSDIAGYVPADLTGTIAVMALNPEGIKKLIRSNEDLDGMVNMMAREKNLNFDTFLAAGDGQVLYVNDPRSASMLRYLVLGVSDPNLVADLLPKFTNPDGAPAKEVEPGIYQLQFSYQEGQPEVSYYFTLSTKYLLASDDLALLKQGKSGNNQGEFQKEFKEMNQYPLWTLTRSNDKRIGTSRSYWNGQKGAAMYENNSGKSANTLRMVLDDTYLQYKAKRINPPSPELPQ